MGNQLMKGIFEKLQFWEDLMPDAVDFRYAICGVEMLGEERQGEHAC